MTTTAAAAGTRRHTGTYPAEPRQVGLARAELAGWLGGRPQADEAILVASEFATNSVLFSLLSFRVAIAAAGGQADLRPALLDYLFLAAACCGTCETAQPPSSAGQLRHGYHRTRRLRREAQHSAARDGGAFTLRAEVGRDRVRIEVEDAGGPWRDGPRDDGRPHGFDVVAAIAGRGTGERTGTTASAPPGLGSAGEIRMTVLPPPADAAQVSCFLADQPLVMYVSRDAKCRLALTPLKFTTTRYR